MQCAYLLGGLARLRASERHGGQQHELDERAICDLFVPSERNKKEKEKKTKKTDFESKTVDVFLHKLTN